MRCTFESRQENLTIYPFPGLKVINIRGTALLALDLIIIGNFVASLHEHNQLSELALRDYQLDETGFYGLLPCLPLVRTVTLCAKKLSNPACYYSIADALDNNRLSKLRELWLLLVPPANMDLDEPDELGAALLRLKEVCKYNNVRLNMT